MLGENKKMLHLIVMSDESVLHPPPSTDPAAWQQVYRREVAPVIDAAKNNPHVLLIRIKGLNDHYYTGYAGRDTKLRRNAVNPLRMEPTIEWKPKELLHHHSLGSH